MILELFGYSLEFITALIATITWKKYRSTQDRNFVYFFWVVLIMDVSGFLIDSKIPNQFIYNLLLFFYFVFLFSWYYKILENKLSLKLFTVLYFFVVIISIIKQNFFEELLSIHFVGGSLIIVFCALLYFKQLLNSNAILSIKHSLSFWITIGNIIFFVGMLPIFLLQKYMDLSYLAYGIVITVVNFITYSCYILGFIWTKNKL